MRDSEECPTLAQSALCPSREEQDKWSVSRTANSRQQGRSQAEKHWRFLLTFPPLQTHFFFFFTQL